MKSCHLKLHQGDNSACGEGWGDNSACGEGWGDNSACGEGWGDNSACGEIWCDNSFRGGGGLEEANQRYIYINHYLN